MPVRLQSVWAIWRLNTTARVAHRDPGASTQRSTQYLGVEVSSSTAKNCSAAETMATRCGQHVHAGA